jgi:phosphoserine phosphatase
MPAYDLVFFDCDSTLSTIEGIDELAVRAGVNVKALTDAAMAGELPLADVYRKRLELINPTSADFAWLAQRYAETALPDTAEVIGQLQNMGVACHVISGGLFPGVAPFAETLGIQLQHPLARNGGKPEIVAAVGATLGIPQARRLLIGDGVSDLEARSAVGIFVGFGGVVTRQEVFEKADVFLNKPHLGGLIPIVQG